MSRQSWRNLTAERPVRQFTLNKPKIMKEKECPAHTAIKKLAEEPSLTMYQDLKKIVHAENTDVGIIVQLLLAAARTGIIRDVELIIPVAIDRELSNEMGDALIEAAKFGHLTVMKTLVTFGAPINHRCDSALCQAVKSELNDSVIFLLENGAGGVIDDGYLIELCCETGDNDDILETLIASGVDVMCGYQKAYQICLRKFHTKCAAILLKHSGSDLNQKRFEGFVCPGNTTLAHDDFVNNDFDLIPDNGEELKDYGSGDSNSNSDTKDDNNNNDNNNDVKDYGSEDSNLNSDAKNDNDNNNDVKDYGSEDSNLNSDAKNDNNDTHQTF